LVKIVRLGITFPPELLDDFDSIIRKMGYKNRSKAIQDSVASFISEYKHLEKEKGERVGVLSVLYDHTTKGLEEKLTHIQHRFSSIILSTMHVHLDEKDCLQAIAVKGDTDEIRKLLQSLLTNKGVKQAKLGIVSASSRT
jgi:CopG family nickel-responsive transcriptional regulator